MIESERDLVNVVNATFRAHRIKCRATSMFVAPAHLFLSLTKARDVKVSHIVRMIDDLQHDVATQRRRHGIVESTTCRMSTTPLALEINRVDAQLLSFDTLRPSVFANMRNDLRLREYDVACGVHFEPNATRPIVFNLSDASTPHALVAGTTGSGKSIMLRSMIATLCDSTPPANLAIMLADLKGGDASDGIGALAELPHVVEFTTDASRASAFAALAVSEIDNAKRRHKILLVIDEVQALDANAVEHVKRISQVGRSVGVHLFLATQYPNHAAIASIIKANLPVRIVGSVMSAIESNVALGLPASGAERLPGRGAFLTRIESNVERVQNWLVDDIACKAHVAAMRARWRHARTHSLQIAEHDDESASLPAELVEVFDTYANADGTLARGGLTRAIEALYSRVPTGEPYRRARESVLTSLQLYCQNQSVLSAESASRK